MVDVMQVDITIFRKQNINTNGMLWCLFFYCLYKTMMSIYKTNYVTMINFKTKKKNLKINFNF